MGNGTNRASEGRWGCVFGFVVGLVGATASCGDAGAFVCESDVQCGDAGHCEPTGYCSLPDAECVSGRRYQPLAAPRFQGECVGEQAEDPPDATTGGPPDDEGSSGTSSVTSDDRSRRDDGKTQPDWWHPAWGIRRWVTFGNSRLPVLHDESVLIRIGASELDGFAPGGRDLRVIDADGITPLPYEVAQWDDQGAAVWVAVPEIDAGSDTDGVWLYYGNPDAPIAETPEAVWATNYLAVWHCGDLRDSSPAPHLDATDHGTTKVEGIVGDARGFDGLAGYIEVGAPIELDDLPETAGSISAFVNATSLGPMFDKRPGWGLSLVGDETGSALQLVRSGVGTWATATGSFSLERWHHVAIVLDDPPVAYIDGEPSTLTPLTTQDDPVSDVGNPLRIGYDPSSASAYLAGSIDEIRIAEVSRSDASIRAEYLMLTERYVSMADPELR